MSELKERITGRLGDLLPLKYGKSLPAAVRDSTGSVPVYGSSGVVGSHSSALTTGPVIVVGRKGNVGAVHYSAVPCWPIDTAYFAEPPMGHDPRYYRYLLDSLGLARLDKSTAIPGLSRDDYNAVEVTIHPPEHQAEVVAEIEKQFSRLDEAVANLQRVKANLKRYKASVLKAAVEGRLSGGGADAFRRTCLGELVELNPRLPKGSLDESSSVTFVPMAAVGADDGHIDVTAIRSYSEVRKGYTYFANGDVLFAKVTPCMENGKIAIAKGLVGGIGFGSTEFHVLRPRPDVDPRYVYCIVSSEAFRKEAARHMTGAVGLRRVPTAFMESVEVSVPPFDEQLSVVFEVDRQLTIIQDIEGEVDLNLERSKALRQATLAKAFLNQ